MEKAHIKAASLMLARAFEDDYRDEFPDPEERKRKTPFACEFCLRSEFSYIEAFVTSPRLEGIAIWQQSDKRGKRPFWHVFTSGAIWPALRVGLKALGRILTLDEYVYRKHAELARPGTGTCGRWR